MRDVVPEEVRARPVAVEAVVGVRPDPEAARRVPPLARDVVPVDSAVAADADPVATVVSRVNVNFKKP